MRGYDYKQKGIYSISPERRIPLDSPQGSTTAAVSFERSCCLSTAMGKFMKLYLD